MPLQGMSIMKNATGGMETPTGGTATVFNTDGVETKNGIHLADLAETNFIVRSNITCKNRNPVLSPDGSYSKAKRSISIVVPKVLADLSTSFSVVRIDVEFHPELTVAEIDNLRYLGAQMLLDADVVSFITSGSLA